MKSAVLSSLARHPAATSVVAAALLAWTLVTVSTVRSMGTDTTAGTLGALVHHCSGGYDLRDIDWIADAAAAGRPPYFAQPDADGHLVSPFGPLPALLAAPVMFDLRPGDQITLGALRHRVRLVSSLLLALCAGLLAWAARPGAQPWRAAATGLVAAASFAGAATLGQALWQQTVSLLPLVAGFAVLVRRDDHPRLAVLAPALLIEAALIRPALGPLVLGLGAWWVIATRPRAARGTIATALAIAVALPLAAWNWRHWGSPLPLGQWHENAGAAMFRPSLAQLGVGLGGLLVSPARGLVWFAPIAVIGIARALRAPGERLLGVALLAQLAVMALYYEWWGGYCFGPRYLAEVAWLATWAALATPVASRAWRGAIAACAGVTVAVGLLGLWRQPMKWEAVHDVNDHRGALWQLADGVLPDLVTGRDERVHLRDELYRVCDGPRVELEASVRSAR